MLKKVMDRLKIPTQFTDFILQLFQDRKNQVFTEYGLTDPYDVQIGIDQGEIISPILWCIYYDPLLCEIDQQKLGYTITQCWYLAIAKDFLAILATAKQPK